MISALPFRVRGRSRKSGAASDGTLFMRDKVKASTYEFFVKYQVAELVGRTLRVIVPFIAFGPDVEDSRTGEVKMDEKMQFTLEEAHLHFAKTLNGETWNLLDKENRTVNDNERMLAAAFASYYHWLLAGKEVHRQRGEYMIARVFLALGNLQESLTHARRCLELTDQFKDQMEDFDFAFAYEIFARVNAANGQVNTAREYREKAQKAGDQIKDDENRNIFFTDFNAGNWFNL